VSVSGFPATACDPGLPTTPDRGVGAVRGRQDSFMRMGGEREVPGVVHSVSHTTGRPDPTKWTAETIISWTSRFSVK